MKHKRRPFLQIRQPPLYSSCGHSYWFSYKNVMCVN